MSKRMALSLLILCSVAWALGSPPAEAAGNDPAIYIIGDTSGSMLQDPAGADCHGDGSREHPHYQTNCQDGVNPSRIWTMKDSIYAVVAGYPEVRWGLARFSQTSSWNEQCRSNDLGAGNADPGNYTDGACTTGGPGYKVERSYSWPTVDICVPGPGITYSLSYDLPGVLDPVCSNYSGNCTGGDILVALDDNNEDRLLKWVNHKEHWSGDPSTWFYPGRHPTTGDYCWSNPGSTSGVFGDCEMRAFGVTPLGGALNTIYDQIANTDLDNDPAKECRPYSVILLTDGSPSSCDSVDVDDVAGYLQETPDLQAGVCASNADCPPGITCKVPTDPAYTQQYCVYQVRTYAIAFATTPTQILRDAATNGGTGAPIEADERDELVSAMAGIISDSIIPELCNGSDDNCNGEVDEGYPLGVACDNGLLGICQATGVYECDPGDDTQVRCDAPTPSPEIEICNGLDDDCDGDIDEDNVCFNGPEICNGQDDYCGPGIECADNGDCPGGNCDTGTGFCVCQGDPDCPGATTCNGDGRCCHPPICQDNADCPGTTVCDTGTGYCECTQDSECPGAATCNTSTSYCEMVDGDEDPRVYAGKNAVDCGTDVGQCDFGSMECNLGAVSCEGQVGPFTETCGSEDFNCNGIPFDAPIQECVVQPTTYGSCPGIQICQDLGGGTIDYGDCLGAAAVPEICNGADENCNCDTSLAHGGDYNGDGVVCGVGPGGTDTGVDEGLGQTTCGVGACERTVDNCVNGATQTCTPGAAGSETCNGTDDDCDGAVDENLFQACWPASTAGCPGYPGPCVGECQAGTQACVGGNYELTCTNAITPQPEICDNKDNDCDGNLDNAVTGDPALLTQSCYTGPAGTENVGVCVGGDRTCTGGSYGSCEGQVLPSGEVCNGANDDCDAATDEDPSTASGYLEKPCTRTNGFGTCTGIQECDRGVAPWWDDCSASVPAAETCNEIDDDCDGVVDDGVSRECYPAATAGCPNFPNCYGECSVGTEQCQVGPGLWTGTCSGATTPQPEICDNKDNDCDNVVDNFNRQCYPFASGCTYDSGTGTYTCAGACHAANQNCIGGNWTNPTCFGAQGPATESCDGVDNDCDCPGDTNGDGTVCGSGDTNVDEDLTQECYPAATLGCTLQGDGSYDCEGECEAGTRTCVNAAYDNASCSDAVTPDTEICDGLDNNCDGNIDEGFGNITCGTGVCQITISSCVGGVPQSCVPLTPQAEICNNLDDDCDGIIDNAVTGNPAPLSQSCYSGPTGTDANAPCHAGTQQCITGQWQSCQGEVVPAAEICDGIDNDCDGHLDNAVTNNPAKMTQACVNTVAGVGTCTGIQTCESGGLDDWGTCSAATPSPETCNGQDDNCDLKIDGISQECFHTTTPGDLGTGCEDPDADGIFTCEGECKAGTQLCPELMTPAGSNSFGDCQAVVGPEPEQCDGLDNDCDARIDEELTRQCFPYGSGCDLQPNGTYICRGVCAAGQQTCQEGGSGQWNNTSCTDAAGPSAEVCDGLDNDCDCPGDTNGDSTVCGIGDTNVDEGLGTTSCGLGVCAHTIDNCQNGAVATCDPLWNQGTEVCDGLDNDCDGQTDENLGTTTCGQGICQRTVQNCLNGVPQTCVPLSPQGEICNNLDDDCDGTIDNAVTGNPAPLSLSCYSGPAGTDANAPCHAGTDQCIAGQWQGCQGEVVPAAEICDGIDNDCDGHLDNAVTNNPDKMTQSCANTVAGVGTCTGIQTCQSGGLDDWSTCSAATPSTETCNGQDDDCDLKIDGISQECFHTTTPGDLGTGCEDPDADGIFTCEGECKAGTQLCPELMTPAGSNSFGDCQAVVGPEPEQCDGLDNDCDGRTDEELTRQCFPYGSGCDLQPDGTYVCRGVCAAGQQTCQEGGTGQWNNTTCTDAAGPSAEVCDGLDNDCDCPGDTNGDSTVCGSGDTNVDEGLGSTSCGLGVCAHTSDNCQNGVLVPCDPFWNQGTEVCDGLDNDCDGDTDENLGSTTCGQGICERTVQNCLNGIPQTCIPFPSQAEECNGLDDDCDGLIDEGPDGQPMRQACYTGPAGTENNAPCHVGYSQCTGGQWTACTNQVTPVSETCNGIDDDCDGLTDEDPNDPSQPINEPCQNSKPGVGTCLGTRVCTNGSLTTCDATEPFAETCNGIDDDCDGVIDGFTEPCYEDNLGVPYASGCDLGTNSCEGICQIGVRICPRLTAPAAGNAMTECRFAVGPAEEICDNLDNDCDGTVDMLDGTPLNRVCYWPGYADQTGHDTGCDAPGDCVGACREGLQICGDVVQGEWSDCYGEVTPTTEVCDATDNDCDGNIDEVEDMPWVDQPCPASMGVCNGIWKCTNGVKECVGLGVQPGRCNGLDDNCDGVIDDNTELAEELAAFPVYTQPCGDTDEGECEYGDWECVGGGWQCVGDVGPGEETCNGLDDNCDGDVDVGAVCPPVGEKDSWCIEAECRVACDPGEFPCPGGMECQSKQTPEGADVQVCMPIVGECGGQTCPDGWICQNDVCVDPCDPNPCDWWETCNAGSCLDYTCSGPTATCPPDQFCVNHACVGDPCLNPDCDPRTEYCVRDCDSDSCDARCESVCLCPAGERCTASGGCETDPCAETNCDLAGTRCDPDTGNCEADPCVAVFCGGSEVCYEGDCIEDPCDLVVCPPFFNCEVVESEGGSDATPVGICAGDPAFWVPGEDGEKYLATGGGGCQCQSTGGPDGAGLLAFLGVLGFLWRRRRRAATPTAPSRRRTGALFGLGALVALLTLGAGCNLDPYETGSGGGWNFPDGDLPDRDIPDAQVIEADACVAASEICDNADNDCDEEIDEDFDLTSDPNNCGSCDNVCSAPHAISECENSTCIVQGCLPGYHDLDSDSSNGCEYACQYTNGEVEACDGKDNDCDGSIDEDFDLTTDPVNCGECANVCVFLNSTGECQAGLCHIGACRGGFADVDGDVDNGCECQMNLTAGTVVCTEGDPVGCPTGEVCADVTDDGTAHCATIPVDLCDGKDNDCDGLTDEDATSILMNSSCYTLPAGCSETSPGSGNYSCLGPCQAGTWQCVDGELACQNQVGPRPESCNSQDDNCNCPGDTNGDGTVCGPGDDGVDEDWDITNDPSNCGGCGVACGPQLPNAIPTCVAGTCQIAACLPGFYNNDPNAPGCEYACVPHVSGREICGNGVDDDCNCTGDTNGDGTVCGPGDNGVDEGFDTNNDPNHCGQCDYSCDLNRPPGTRTQTPACSTGTCRYECADNYHNTTGTVEDGCEYYCVQSGTPVGTEICDGKDNDCDTDIDEGFKPFDSNPLHCNGCNRNCANLAPPHMVLDTSASSGCLNSVCQYQCETTHRDLNGNPIDGCECELTNGGNEICDGIDNDCDGVIDEGHEATDAKLFYQDSDTDGFGNAAVSRMLCTADATNHYTIESEPSLQFDCNDNNADIHPGQVEICNGLDDDCDCTGDTDGDGNFCDPGDDNVDEDNATGVRMERDCYTGTPTTENVGPCHGGSQRCGDNGFWEATCQGEVTPEPEVCDTQDNDCDNAADEDFDNDVTNCEGCGDRCDQEYLNSYVTCASNTCVFLGCKPNYHDWDGNPANGCEGPCVKVSEEPLCTTDPASTVDQNCNGLTDYSEWQARLLTDEGNCGSCAYRCNEHTPSGTQLVNPGGCSAGVCQYECAANFTNLTGTPQDGCEYYCVPSGTPVGTEICDGRDNDCDCPGDTNGNGTICDPQDDGFDEGFDLQVQEAHCGRCNYDCSDNAPPHMVLNTTVAPTGCLAGECQYQCAPNYGDANNSPADGCECPESNGGVETCGNSTDDDCDGQVDEPDDADNSVRYYKDSDDDGYGDQSDWRLLCGPDAANKYVIAHTGSLEYDCNDNNADIHPGATETCNGVDDDCDCTGDTDGDGNVCDGGDDNVDEDNATGVRLVRDCYTGTPTTEDVGPCHGGTQQCGDDGFWEATCQGEVTPEPEVCDTQDNDCDNAADEDFDNDVTNCEGCGDRCDQEYLNSYVTCASNTCVFLGCKPNYYDWDGNTANGCEGPCVKVSDEPLCTTDPASTVDQNCNGLTDYSEWQARLLTDEGNCGSCAYRCNEHTPSGTQVQNPGGCSAGVCQYECAANFTNLTGTPQDGCEYYCVPSGTPVGTEVCDGRDNDCDCPGDTNGNGTICDPQDDGFDEGFDLQTQEAHCGRCDFDCSNNAPPHMVLNTTVAPTGCLAGVCQYQCAPNYGDANNSQADGCECPENNGGVETCGNSTDDDCDGQVDEPDDADNSVRYYKDGDDDGYGDQSDWRLLCGPDVANKYVIAHTGSLEYDCNDANGDIHPGATEICNGLDDDCDCTDDTDGDGNFCDGGDDNVDEDNATGVRLERNCYTGLPGTEGTGPCHGGTQQCGDDGFWETACSGQQVPTDETCNLVDDDCDSDVDEDFRYNVNSCGDGVSACVDCTVTYPNSIVSCDNGSCASFGCLPDWHDTNPGQPGCEYNCTKVSDEPLCTMTSVPFVDQDCDQQNDYDEWVPLRQTDMENCGTCGYSCAANAPVGTVAQSCTGGSCVYVCDTNYFDIDSNTDNGCEYHCIASGAEICDEIDNNCNCRADSNGDGTLCGPGDTNVDEGFNLLTDQNNCGQCGNACAQPGASYHARLVPGSECQGGKCTFECLAGYHDLNGNLNNGLPFGAGNDGCEYGHCLPSGDPTEVCDGADNDCDGHTDADGTGTPLTRECFPDPGGLGGCAGPDGSGHYTCAGICRAGTETCSSPGWSGTCVGAVYPQATETCGDGLDNDCNGTTDTDYDQSNIRTCGTTGACGTDCLDPANIPLNMIPTGCDGTNCTYICDPEWADNDSAPGCEYRCPQSPPGAEICDNIDNDCDGDVDNGLPATKDIGCPQGAAGSLCQGTLATCRDPGNGQPYGWYCNWASGVEYDTTNHNALLPREYKCDTARGSYIVGAPYDASRDGDCDGFHDEDFNVGNACVDPTMKGECQASGTIQCDSVGSPTASCLLGAPPQAAPLDEVCNDKDDDCDGQVDESVASNIPADDQAGSHDKWVMDDTVWINVGPPHNYAVEVYQFEASRSSAAPDARACSQTSVMPWNYVTHADAEAACGRAGMRLCYAWEWQEACDGQNENFAYPYTELEEDYVGSTCNGADAGNGAEVSTGTLGGCTSEGYSIFDLSGNVREWTNDHVGNTGAPDNLDIYRLRGGSYLEGSGGLTCGQTNSAYVEDVNVQHVGFRCCNSCGNGELESWEECDDGNRVSGDGCDASCQVEAPSCGNGWVDSGEDCDDGLVSSPYCNACAFTFGSGCGNGWLESGEECDDGDTSNGDGCSSTCTVENLYSCDGYPTSTCTSTCRNGLVELGAGEECDDDNANNSDGCSNACTINAGYECTGSPSLCITICGNGDLDGTEECDDGNNANGDGCSSTCQTEWTALLNDMDTDGCTDAKATWTRIDNYDNDCGGDSQADTWACCTQDSGVTRCTGSRPTSWDNNGNYWAVDSADCGNYDMDEELISPTLNLQSPTDYHYLYFTFVHDFQKYGSENDIGTVDYSVDGGAWQNLATYQADTAQEVLQYFDVSFLAGETNVRFRFHYSVTSGDAWYWLIDDPQVYATTYNGP